MKTALLLLLLAIVTPRHHRHRDDPEGKSLLTKTKKRECAEYGLDEGRLFTLYENTITCGDKLQERQSNQFPDPACCLVAPDTCASANPTPQLGAKDRKRRLHKQDEEEAAAPAPAKEEEKPASKCLFCIQHPCNPSDHPEDNPVLCI